jgi:hypothetical protein
MEHIRKFEIEPGFIIEIDRRWADIGADLAVTSSQIAANMRKCVDVLAWLTREIEIAEVQFLVWKSQKKCKYLADEPKLAEWKCKDRYRAEPDYKPAADNIARLHADEVWIKGMKDALLSKAHTVNRWIEFDGGVGWAERLTNLAPGATRTTTKRGRVKPAKHSSNQ